MRASRRVMKEILKSDGYIWLSVDFSAESLQARKKWDDTLLKEKKLPTKNILFRNEDLKALTGKQKLRVFIMNRSVLQEMLKGGLQAVKKGC